MALAVVVVSVLASSSSLSDKMEMISGLRFGGGGGTAAGGFAASDFAAVME